MADRLGRRGALRLGLVAATAGLAGCGSRRPEASGAGGTNGTSTGGANGTSTGGSNRTAESTAASPYARVYRETIDSVVSVRTGSGEGTGFLFEEGLVATNAHVVGENRRVDVRYRDGRYERASVAGSDPQSDLAVLEVDAAPGTATPLTFADDPATVGQEVVAIGNPFSLEGSVTAGIVAGTDRSIPSPSGFRIPDAIQTDAAVNPGNSGGPLCALDGRVVAVINSGRGDNIAFGISAALARRVLPALAETGSFEHSFVGIALRNVTPVVARANDLERARGILVVDVLDGGPAQGVLRPSEDTELVDGERIPVGGDVVVGIDGTEVVTNEDLGSYLALETRPGDAVTLRVLRDGSERTVELTLGTRPENVQSTG